MEATGKDYAVPTPLTTRDGHRVLLTAVASMADEARRAVQLGAEGIGLFTCESLYRDTDRPPSEEELLGLYGTLAAVPAARETVIRLPDLDWHEWPAHEPEKNPALGCRGTRLALATPGLWQPQLRAVLRAGAVARLRLALPFVSTVGEVLQVKRLLRDLTQELEESGLPCASPVLGLMTDLPAVAAAYDIMACEARFFHVGDNMIKYLMGTDRGPADPGSPDPFDPAFLLQCRALIENLHRRHKKVAVSAGIVREPAAIPVLIGLGFDELTVPADLLAQTRQLVQQTRYNTARLTAAKAISFWDPREARQYALEALDRVRI